MKCLEKKALFTKKYTNPASQESEEIFEEVKCFYFRSYTLVSSKSRSC